MSVIESMRITDPLPQRFLTQTPGVGGRIKLRPEDFLVDEIPLYEPEGTGEHLYLGIQKTNVSHGEMMSCLRRQFGVREFAIGYAGMGSLLTVLFGRPLVRLNYDQSDREASLRSELVSLRENAESVATVRGWE